MPEPQIADYNLIYKVTPAFEQDLKTVLGDIAYVDAKKYIDRVKESSGIMPLVKLNEFINQLMDLPYRIISPLIVAISKKEIFDKYFEVIEK